MGRRRLRRTVVRIPATYKIAAGIGSGHIKSVTPGGIFFRTETPLPVSGEPVKVIFLDLFGGKIEVSGTVGWTTAQLDPAKQAKPGFGMQIDQPSAEYLEFYEQLLTRTPAQWAAYTGRTA